MPCSKWNSCNSLQQICGKNEEYDKDKLFAHFRPDFQSPDFYEMKKFIQDRRQGVKVPQPDALVTPERALKFDYIVLSAMLCLDEQFTERLRTREEGWSDADAKTQREDTFRSVELNALHRYAIDYHMEVVRTHPAFHLAFLKASEFARMLIRKEQEAETKREEEFEERGTRR